MKHIKQATLADELSDHIEVGLPLKVNAHTHIQDYIRMAQLVEHLDFFNEVFQSFSSHVSFAKLLDGDFCTEPAGLENISIPTSTNQMRVWVDYKLFEIDKEVETVLSQGCDETRFLSKNHR